MMGKQSPPRKTPTTPHELRNKIGRPCASKSINYAPQPMSIVSLILQKMIKEKKVIFPLEQNDPVKDVSEPICIINEDEDSVCNTEEADQSENQDLSLEEKKAKKCKNGEKPDIYRCHHKNCSYTTKISSNLLKHNRTHTGEKPYLCDQCSFRTNFSNSLKVHKRLHTDIRPYECKKCDYKCNSVSNLKKHLRCKHKDPQSKKS